MPVPTRARRPFVLALSAGLAAGATPQSDNPPQDLPVTGVTLYRSGVGSFERSGTVSGTSRVRLDASAEQIDDLLKSLVVLDLDGGRVGPVTYTADEPVARLLDALGVASPDQLTLNRILSGFKGAAVQLEVTGRETIKGRILGVDSISTSDGGGGATITRSRVSLLTPAGVVTAHDDEIRAITFDDTQLRADFEALLTSLAEQRTEQSRSLDIELLGQGERRVRAVYTQETPVWKTSYRVLIPETDDGTLQLQGWAIVENTTDSDWDDITLSLVAGRPVGFTMPLSQPLFVPRPELAVPVELAAAPKAYDRGVEGGDEFLRLERGRADAGRSAGMQRSVAANQAPGRLLDMVEAVSAEDAMRSSFAAAASSDESGEVFFYRLNDPVTVGRRQSAMIPILTESIEGRRVSITSPNDGIGHPMRGLEMTNSGDLKLMPGPVSVYDSGAFAGDAQIGYVGAGDDRMLSFGVDLDVSVERTTRNRAERIEQITIRDGVFIKRVFNQIVDRVSIDNADAKRGRTVIVEINAREGWELESATPLYESAPGLHRFAVEVDPGRQAAIETRQSRTSSTQLALSSLTLQQMVSYNRTGSVSDGVLAAFQGYADRRASIDDLQRVINELDAETGRLSQDQERIRRLMGSVSRQDALHARYLRTLEQHENRLEAIRSERTDAETERQRLQNELNSYVRGLKVE
ncbi:MAG: hypothetical protein AAF937_11090 [Planctomycetota bacterium]